MTTYSIQYICTKREIRARNALVHNATRVIKSLLDKSDYLALFRWFNILSMIIYRKVVRNIKLGV